MENNTMYNLIMDVLKEYENNGGAFIISQGYKLIFKRNTANSYSIKIYEFMGKNKQLISIFVYTNLNEINMFSYIDKNNTIELDCVHALREIYPEYSITGKNEVVFYEYSPKPKTKKVLVKQYLEYEVEIPVDSKVELSCYYKGEEVDLIKDCIIEEKEIK